MDHSQIDELISNMLKNRLIYGKPSKKVRHILLWRQQITIMKKPVDKKHRRQYWKQQLLS